MDAMTDLGNAGYPMKLQVSYIGGCEEINSPAWNKDDSGA
jgi:hypothetical protein